MYVKISAYTGGYNSVERQLPHDQHPSFQSFITIRERWRSGELFLATGQSATNSVVTTRSINAINFDNVLEYWQCKGFVTPYPVKSANQQKQESAGDLWSQQTKKLCTIMPWVCLRFGTVSIADLDITSAHLFCAGMMQCLVVDWFLVDWVFLCYGRLTSHNRKFHGPL